MQQPWGGAGSLACLKVATSIWPPSFLRDKRSQPPTRGCWLTLTLAVSRASSLTEGIFQKLPHLQVARHPPPSSPCTEASCVQRRLILTLSPYYPVLRRGPPAQAPCRPLLRPAPSPSCPPQPQALSSPPSSSTSFLQPRASRGPAAAEAG